jgi:hypothetical protein
MTVTTLTALTSKIMKHRLVKIDEILQPLYEKASMEDKIHIRALQRLIKASIEIPLSEREIQELQDGETFNWTFDGVDVKLYKED